MHRRIPIAILVLLTAAAAVFGIQQLRLSEREEKKAAEQPKKPQCLITEKIEIRRSPVSCSEQRCISCTLRAGEKQTIRQGSDGISEQTVKITYENGTEVSRKVLSTQTVQQPTDRIVLCGAAHEASVQTHPAEPTADGGVLKTPEGETFSYTKVLSCTATAYSCEGYTGTTAIGTTARIGAVAVDPRYIPYGTKMYIVSDDGAYVYGVATAEDCGNFRGYHIDLYFDTVSECCSFGRRSVTVYILS